MEAESKVKSDVPATDSVDSTRSRVNWVWKVLVALVAALAIGTIGWMIGRSGRPSAKSRRSSDSSAREERTQRKQDSRVEDDEVRSESARQSGDSSDSSAREKRTQSKHDSRVDVYEAKSEFTMDVRRSQGANGVGVTGNDMDYYSNYEEIFNTRLSDWRSDALYTKVIQHYRTNYPNATVSDRELVETLRNSKLELVRHSRLITIAVRSKSPELAAALANAYAEAIESFTDEENKKRCDKAVAQVHAQVVNHRKEDDKLAKKLLDFRKKNIIDSLVAVRAVYNQSLSTTTANVLDFETRVRTAKVWVDELEAAQKNPEKFGELPTGVPRSADIAAVYTKWRKAKAELDAVKTWANSEHPQLLALEKNYKAVDKEFKDTVERAYKTAQANLAGYTNQLNEFKQKSTELKKSIDDIGLKIVKAEATLKQLEMEKKVSSEIYQDLLQKENEHRIAAEQQNEIIRVGRPATVPTSPVKSGPALLRWGNWMDDK